MKEFMKALFIQHDHVSPTGWVGEALARHGFELTEVLVVPESSFENPNVSFEFPDFNDYDLLIPLGAPWGAWDDACIGNWLQPELDWIKRALEAEKPVLGICFGGQLMARALGGSLARRVKLAGPTSGQIEKTWSVTDLGFNSTMTAGKCLLEQKRSPVTQLHRKHLSTADHSLFNFTLN